MPKVNRRLYPVVICLSFIAVLVSCGAIISFKNNLSKSTKIRTLNTTAGDISLLDGVFEYPLSVPAGVDSIQVRVVLEDASSQLTIGGLPCASGQWSPSLTIKKGHKLSIPIVVSTGSLPGAAETPAIYTITVDPEKTWSKPEPLGPYSEGVNQVNPQIVENDAGHTVAVWWQQVSSSANWDLVVSERDDGGEWTFPVVLYSKQNAAYRYLMRINENGCVIITWIDVVTPGIFTTIKRNGRWYSVDEVKTFETVGNVVDIHGFTCFIDKYDNAVVVWTSGISNSILKSALLVGETTWSENIKVIENSSMEFYNVAVDINEHGNGYIAWYQQDSSGFRIYVKKYDSIADRLGKTIGPLDEGSMSGNQNPEVVIDKENEGFIVWEDYTNKNVKSTIISSDGQTINPNEIISKGIECGVSEKNNKILSGEAQNSLLVVFHEKRIISGSSGHSLYAVTSNGRQWGNPVKLTKMNSIVSFSPCVDQNREGRAVVAYKCQLIDGTSKLGFALFNGAWLPEHEIDSLGVRFDSPYASIDSFGEVTCLWSQAPASGGSSKIMVDYYR